MTTYIKDLINLPDKVHGGDFVLKLTEGVNHPEATLTPYVVTPQLSDCFDQSLDFIKGAVQEDSSKAAYLHGSFGSGKSHFMAVLHLLLQQHPTARSKEGLETVVTKHNDWLEGKNFLLVPYHMIGKNSMEEAVLGGYVRRITELHPDAPLPGVYHAQSLFHDANRLRKDLGDNAFFGRLNRSASSGGDGGWGDLDTAWDAASYDVAVEAPPGSDDRSRLIGALVGEFFQSYKNVARGNQEAFVSLDDGLAIISRHAQKLGYDALVLFLDELILWLATHAADQNFLNTEGPKVSKLVEAESADRPIPIVSFVARQRDLKELVGDSITGAEQLGFADVLRWWEARFDTITLEDRNLPEIAARRVLLPKSEAARQQFDRAWEAAEKIRAEVFDVLLTPQEDRSSFRKVYPFSPALVKTLVAVSSVLQRERTALKVMLQLLVNQRDTLELGQIVPVGDLFDVIAEGDEPFTEGMRIHFENAKRLYEQKLLPMLERDHGTTAAQVQALPYGDNKAKAFRADDRLIKTLLLASLVPEVEVLKNLNSARLTALNHGSIKSPIAGRERQEVLRRVKQWASQVGEIKIGDETDPVINLQLSGVDTEGILANVQASDSFGNRRRKVRELLFEQLGVADQDALFIEHEIVWRGSRRDFQVIFGNVRELTTESLKAEHGARKIVIDFPFDESDHGSSEDLDKLDQFRSSAGSSRTLVWIPTFLSAKAQKELGTLVKLDEALKSDDSLARHASHMSALDRQQARIVLDNQRAALRQRIIRYLDGAYGVDNAVPESLDEGHSPEPFQSLDPSFAPQPPVGMNLRQALEHLLSQMLSSQFPAHPEFGAEIKIGTVRKVQAQIARAAQESDSRIDIDRPLRPLMHQVAVPLRLGEMGETHFVLGRQWYNHFNKEVVGDGQISVAMLRAAMDRPKPMGLPKSIQNLLIMLYADQTNRSFFHHGGPYPPKLESLPDDLELREQQLPTQEQWDAALQRAGKIFGIAVSELRNATNASDLAARLGEAAAPQGLEDCQVVCDRLVGLCDDYGVEEEKRDRLKTARAVWQLLRDLAEASDTNKVDVLAASEVATSLDAMGTSYRKAPAVRRAIESVNLDVFGFIANLTDDRVAAAEGIRQQLVQSLGSNEYAVALQPRLKALEDDAVRLLAPKPTPPPPRPTPGVETVDQGAGTALSGGEAGKTLETLLGRIQADPELTLDITWKLLRKKGQQVIAVPTIAQIRAQVAAVRNKVPDARVIGIRVPPTLEVGDSLTMNDVQLDVASCQSVLEVRERLLALATPPLVLLTGLSEAELGADVVAQLAKRRLFKIEPWQLVKDLFQARYVDPRLVERHPWVARALIESEPKGGFPPAPSGFVEAELAWRVLFAAQLGLRGGKRDPETLLDWSLDPTNRQRLMDLSDDVRAELAEAVRDSSGVLSDRIFRSLASGFGEHAVSVGLVARVLFGDAATHDATASKATVRLEPYVGGKPLDETLAAGWADAADAVVRRRLAAGGLKAVGPLLKGADRFLQDELLAVDAAQRSDVLRSGFDQRLAALGSALAEFLRPGSDTTPDALWTAAENIGEHVLSDHESTRYERAQMAARLAGWLAAQDTSPAWGSFAEAGRSYRQAESFADWARLQIWDGDPVDALAVAYRGLIDRVREVRESQNKRFAELFANWASTGSHDKSIVPVEDVLNDVVAPLAKDGTVLLVVLDGMSVATYRQLQEDMLGQAWLEFAPEGQRFSPPVVAAMPSVTEVCRSSLFSGKLTQGNQSTERKAFADHAALREVSTPSKPPVLFHKGALVEAGSAGLASEVSAALRDQQQRVVGVVVNAVDDYLAKGDQVRLRWNVDTIRPLSDLLSAARDEGRIVICVSDHGHIPEHETELEEGDTADRWRPAGTSETPRATEVRFEGERVVIEGGSIFAPWSERVRFKPKKNGYHGGASPQEVVIPLGVFAATGTAPGGWQEIARDLPDWWAREMPVAPAIAPRPATPRPQDKRRKGQQPLFVAAEPSPGTTATAGPTWVERLLESELMQAQRKRSARTSLTDDRIRGVLVALGERGGKLTRSALAKQIGVPTLRIGGIVSAMRRLLNVEGYSVLSLDESSDTVELNRELLRTQFELDEASGD